MLLQLIWEIWMWYYCAEKLGVDSQMLWFLISGYIIIEVVYYLLSDGLNWLYEKEEHENDKWSKDWDATGKI